MSPSVVALVPRSVSTRLAIEQHTRSTCSPILSGPGLDRDPRVPGSPYSSPRFRSIDTVNGAENHVAAQRFAPSSLANAGRSMYANHRIYRVERRRASVDSVEHINTVGR